MPTSKPRITITLTDHQHEVLRRMAEFGGTSMSAIVVDLLETSLPMLERCVVMMEAAAKAPEQAKQGLKESLTKAEEEMLPQLQAMMGQLDLLMSPDVLKAEGETETDARSRARRTGSTAAASPPAKGRKRADPPPTNRGVRIPQKPMKKPVKSTASKGGKK